MKRETDTRCEECKKIGVKGALFRAGYANRVNKKYNIWFFGGCLMFLITILGHPETMSRRVF